MASDSPDSIYYVLERNIYITLTEKMAKLDKQRQLKIFSWGGGGWWNFLSSPVKSFPTPPFLEFFNLHSWYSTCVATKRKWRKRKYNVFSKLSNLYSWDSNFVSTIEELKTQKKKKIDIYIFLSIMFKKKNDFFQTPKKILFF